MCVIPFDYILCSVFCAFHRAFVRSIDILASLGELYLCRLHPCCLGAWSIRAHAILRDFLARLAAWFDALRLAALLARALLASGGRFLLPFCSPPICRESERLWLLVSVNSGFTASLLSERLLAAPHCPSISTSSMKSITTISLLAFCSLGP